MEGMSVVRSLLSESEVYIDRGDVVQASEKLYKAAEECIKLPAKDFGLREAEIAEEKGRWTVILLERAVEALTDKLGADVRIGWDAANYLHVWGFHEAKIEIEGVKARKPAIEKLVKLTEEALSRSELAPSLPPL
ncbi:MAG: PaREP1 family protein [Thermofilaceae archaeon]